MNVCFTGTLSNIDRRSAAALVTAAGGQVVQHARQASIVVAGDAPGSRLVMAQALGIAVMDETAFRSAFGAGCKGGAL